MSVRDLVHPEHARAYFDLQLRFAEGVAAGTGRPLTDSVAWYTNLHRRLGLGVLEETPRSAAWQHFAAGLEAAPDHESRLAWVLACYRARSAGTPPPGRHVFGCFGCDAPDADGVLRLHFANRDRDGISPLAPARRALRRRELAELIGYAARAWPEIRRVRGASWLYHLEAYRRLFPAEYVASLRPPDGPLHFHGSSSWGQFLDHRGRVKQAPARAFLSNLQRLDVERLRETFPLPVLQAGADLQAFRRDLRRELG